MKFTETEEECRQVALGFSISRNKENRLPGCVGSLDGLAVRIRKPRKTDVCNPSGYYHRKGYYAIPVQAVCDSLYRFTFFSAKCAGPTHDSVAFSVLSLYNRLSDEGLPQGYWIAADDGAYVCDEHLITPVTAGEAKPGSVGDAFNFFLSSHHIHIKQSFGLLMSRWGALWSPLQSILSENVRVIELAMLLHNYCINCKDETVNGLLDDEKYKEIMEYTRALMNASGAVGLPRRRVKSTRSKQRDILLEKLRREVYLRPSQDI